MFKFIILAIENFQNHLICMVPEYCDTSIKEPVKVQVYVQTQYKEQLRHSSAVDFTYMPVSKNSFSNLGRASDPSLVSTNKTLSSIRERILAPSKWKTHAPERHRQEWQFWQNDKCVEIFCWPDDQFRLLTFDRSPERINFIFRQQLRENKNLKKVRLDRNYCESFTCQVEKIKLLDVISRL